MNKLILFISFLLYSACWSQVTLNPHNTGFLPVSSYSGATINNLINVRIHLNDSNGTQMKQWSLTYRVVGSITNGAENFPLEKLNFRFNSLDATAPFPNGNNAPTAQNLRLITGQLPFSTIESFFVQNSPYNLEVNGYAYLNLKYDVTAEGGAYLEKYKSWANYKVNLIVEIRNRKNEIMHSQPVSFDMQVYPNDSPPQTPTYGLQFDPSAKTVLLEFKTASDYANGVTKTQTKAFSTFSNTPYVIRVNTLTGNLTSTTNKTLPVSAVQLSVRDNQTQAVKGTVSLSSAQQNIITSTAHSANKFFDTVYSTNAGDTTFLNKSSEQYSGTLVFTMIPQ